MVWNKLAWEWFGMVEWPGVGWNKCEWVVMD